MSEERDIMNFLNAETSSKIARELVDHLLRFVTDPDGAGTVDYSYDVSGGKISSREANTWISFNLDKDLFWASENKRIAVTFTAHKKIM